MENKESELMCLFEHIERQEQLLEEFHQEKRGLQEETQRKDEEMETLQDRVNALQMSTRVALDHLESVPEKLSLLEDFKDFRDSSSLPEKTDVRYSKYRIQRDFQQCGDDTKYGIKNFKDDRPIFESSHALALDHASAWQNRSYFLSGPRFSHFNPLPAFTKKTISPDPASIKEDATSLPLNGTNPQSKKEESENKKCKM
ncbi:centrosomal protein of 128 kDa-like [Psammomys obesus]|uniref:centrosomal protein of 128 kDa-like n=1 Tax=Psammomys obesus TaxID=48139 RepID=UPI0024531029|nr:centrosomal protein of 128 kDa-like [Psammomys obesus]